MRKKEHEKRKSDVGRRNKKKNKIKSVTFTLRKGRKICLKELTLFHRVTI